MNRPEIFDAFERLETLTTRARCMSHFLDLAIEGIVSAGTKEERRLLPTELDLALVAFARSEVTATCDTIEDETAALHQRIREGWRGEATGPKAVAG